jgi:hypothetical protein
VFFRKQLLENFLGVVAFYTKSTSEIQVKHILLKDNIMEMIVKIDILATQLIPHYKGSLGTSFNEYKQARFRILNEDGL